MVETIATLITVFCGIFSMIIAACTIQAPYSKTVANVLKTIIMRAKKSIRAWVARDSSGRLFLYRNKPRKSTDKWLSTSVHVCGIPSDAFPSIKWKDNEPTRVCIRIAQYDNQKKLFKQYTHKYQ